MKSIFALVALVLVIGSTASSMATNEKVIILDVRTPEEFKEGHAKGAINIDVLNKDFDGNISKLKKDGSYKVYCRSGNRSGKALQIMKANGFKEVENVGSLNQAIERYGR